MNQLDLFPLNSWIIYPIIIWTLFWKGYSLWTAAKANQKKWFVALLVINSFGILEIIYIFFVAKKTLEDIEKVFSRGWKSILRIFK